MPVARTAVERERGLRREPTLEQLAGLTGQRLEGALGVLAAGNAVLVGVILDLVVQRAGLDLRDQLGGLGLPPQLGRRLLLARSDQLRYRITGSYSRLPGGLVEARRGLRLAVSAPRGW